MTAFGAAPAAAPTYIGKFDGVHMRVARTAACVAAGVVVVFVALMAASLLYATQLFSAGAEYERAVEANEWAKAAIAADTLSAVWAEAAGTQSESAETRHAAYKMSADWAAAAERAAERAVGQAAGHERATAAERAAEFAAAAERAAAELERAAAAAALEGAAELERAAAKRGLPPAAVRSPVVATMIDGRAQADCDVVKEEYAMIKKELDIAMRGLGSAMLDNASHYERVYYEHVINLYDDGCPHVAARANLGVGDKHAPYRLNDEVRVKFMMFGLLPADCEVLLSESQAARANLEAAAPGGPGSMTYDERWYYDEAAWLYESRVDAGEC